MKAVPVQHHYRKTRKSGLVPVSAHYRAYARKAVIPEESRPISKEQERKEMLAIMNGTEVWTNLFGERKCIGIQGEYYTHLGERKKIPKSKIEPLFNEHFEAEFGYAPGSKQFWADLEEEFGNPKMRPLTTVEKIGTVVRNIKTDSRAEIIGSYPDGFVVYLHSEKSKKMLPFKNIDMFEVFEGTY
ncbi:MAG: hypothetical protein AM326_12415 [Candidatus Thorarchaeota archaeon SMTZ-45]|nr:MAG: hypothetical protein AM326_12415 [Candidatus Thorarchaeota archaeon SMTZ-45]